MIGSGEVTGGGKREISHIRGATVRRSGGKETSPCSVRNDGVGVGGGVRRGSGNANVAICEESDWLVGAGGRACDDKEKTTAGGAGVRTGGGACGGGARGGDGGDWAAGGVDGVEGGDGGGGYWGGGREV